MLQQTQIKTVVPYYKRWLRAFPNVKALASAPLDQVLKLWEGLGYYTRARNLHKAAKTIVEQFDSQIPDDAEELRKLPGIGRYTAGAIASIAFQKPIPLVDGNVARVLTRLFNIRKDISKPATQMELYELAGALISQRNPGTFNQALMELGSLVCVPEMPKCHLCPVSGACRAFRKGDPSLLPIQGNKAKIKKIEMVVGILAKDGRLLVRRRPERGIWGGLWEIPGTIRTKNETPEEVLRREFEEAMKIQITIDRRLLSIQHRFTHRLATIHPFCCSLKGGTANQKIHVPSVLWADRKTLKKLSLPRPHQKILSEHLL